MFVLRSSRNLKKSFESILRNFSNQNILTSNLADINVPDIPLHEFVLQNFQQHEKLTAAKCGVTGRQYTYNDIRTKSVYLNRSLRKKLQLKKSDVLAILLPNIPEFTLVTIGALKAGLTVTTINPVYTPEEISRQLADSSTKVIVTLTDFYSTVKTATNFLKTSIPILTIKSREGKETPEGAVNFEEFVEHIDYFELQPANGEETALLPYSSGTTGLPKGVKLSHKNMVANMIQFNHEEIGVVEKTTENHQDVIPALMPQFHIYGLSTTLNMIYRGCKLVTLPKFTPDLYLNTLRAYKPDILFVAPPLLHFLTNSEIVTPQDLNSIRVAFCAAAPLGALDEERFLQKAAKNIRIYQAYGLTETSPILSISRKSDTKNKDRSPGSVGKLLPSTLAKIVDPNDAEFKGLGPGETGELIVKGPQIMKGYHNRPEESKNTFTKDGWLKTGDLMCYNEQGMLFIKDRLKELIKVKGYQVPPAELEEIIRDFPGVDDVAVIGVPHEKHGESPRAYIVESRTEKIDLDKLNGFVNKKVAEYKRLRGGIVIVESIPKNSSGKILRLTLKQQYQSLQ